MGEALAQTPPKDRLKVLLIAILTAEIGLLAYVLFSSETPEIVQEFGLLQDTQNFILYVPLAIAAYQVWRRNRPLGAWWFLFGLSLFLFWGEFAIDQEHLFRSYAERGIHIRAFSVAYLFEDVPLWIKLAVGVPSAILLGIWLRGLWMFRKSLRRAIVFLRRKRPVGLFAAAIGVMGISQFGYLLPVEIARETPGLEEVIEFLGETLFLFAVLDLHIRLREFAPRLLTGSDRWIPADRPLSSLPLVSCIVPAHNEAASLPPTIESLLVQDYPADKLEIVVALNGCTDDSAAVANRYPVKVAESKEKGMSFGKNLGAGATSGDLLVFVDADTILPPQAVSAIVAEMEQHDHAVATMAGLPEKGGPVVKAAFWVANIYTQRTKTHSPGGVIALNREMYASIDGFDEELPQGTSTDLVRRACKAGAEYVCIDTVQAVTSIRRFEKTGIVSQMLEWRKNHRMLKENEREALAKRSYQDVR